MCVCVCVGGGSVCVCVCVEEGGGGVGLGGGWRGVGLVGMAHSQRGCVGVGVLVWVYVCVLVKQKGTKRGSEKVCLSVFSRDSREKIYPDFQGFGRISRLLYDYSMLAAVEKHGNYQKILD